MGSNQIPEIKSCFIITPIGEEGSPENKAAMELIEHVISPVLQNHGFKPVPASKIYESGSINNQIIKRVIGDELVIANLTGLNPNVMYELGIRHAAKKTVIIMAEHGTKLPFDLKDERTIFYHNSMGGPDKAKVDLENMIAPALADQDSDNPITRAINNVGLIKKEGEGSPSA